MAPKAPGVALGDADGGVADGGGVSTRDGPGAGGDKDQEGGKRRRARKVGHGTRTRGSVERFPQDEFGSGMGLDSARIFSAMSSGLRARADRARTPVRASAADPLPTRCHGPRPS